MYKKVSDDYPKRIEPYIDTIDKALGDTYKPMSECPEIKKVHRPKSSYVRHGWGKHENLINDFLVRQYNDSGMQKIYGNIRDASEATGIRYSSICGCIFGRTKTAGGFYWEKYVE